MRKGELATAGLTDVLRTLAGEEATGCVHVSGTSGDEASLYLKNGLLSAVTVPGRRADLAARLLSCGALAPEALTEAVDVQRNELQGWRLSELLVHLGYVDQSVVDAFVTEQMRDGLALAVAWTEGRWRFRPGERTREEAAVPVRVEDALEELERRQARWAELETIICGPTGVPELAASGGASAETALDPDAWSLLCKVDGERSVAELARDGGYTLFEAADIVARLVAAGLVEMTGEPLPAEEGEPAEVPAYGAEPAESGAEPAGEASVPDAGPGEPREEREPPVDEPSAVPVRPISDLAAFDESIRRVSAALSELLGPPPPVQRVAAVHDPDSVADERERVRAAAAAELAVAHAQAEEERRRAEESALAQRPDADVVDLDEVRRSLHGRRRANDPGADAHAEEPAAAAEPVAYEEPAVEDVAVEERFAVEEPVAADEPVAYDEPAVEDVAVEEPFAADEPVAYEEPAVEDAAVEEPVAVDEPVAYEEPAGEPVAAEEPVAVEEPVDEDVPVEESDLVEEFAADEPVAYDEPAVEDVAVEEPFAAGEPVAAEEPVAAGEPVAAEEPVAVEEPAAEESLFDEALFARPVVDEPPYTEPATDHDAFAELTHPEPVFDESLFAETGDFEPAAFEPAAPERPFLEPGDSEPALGLQSLPEAGPTAHVRLQSEHAAAAAAALSALSLEDVTVAEPEPEPEPVVEVDACRDDEPAEDAALPDEPAPAAAPVEIADKSALLRELSSLGFEQKAESPPPPAPAAARPPAQRPVPADRRTKRRGLFGR